jgi:hypothetical protein
MTRYRWLAADWPIPVSTLAARLKTKPFTSSGKHGFVIDRVRDDWLEARYIERIEYRDSVIDPFGKELLFDRVEFRKTAFRVSASKPSIELREPPRSIQPLINQLSELVDFQLFISTESVDVFLWADKVQALLKHSSIIDSVQINTLELRENVTAKMIVRGSVDVRLSYQDITKNHKYTLEKVQLRINDLKKGSIILGNTGAANLEIDDSREEIIAAVRSALIDVKISK